MLCIFGILYAECDSDLFFKMSSSTGHFFIYTILQKDYFIIFEVNSAPKPMSLKMGLLKALDILCPVYDQDFYQNLVTSYFDQALPI